MGSAEPRAACLVIGRYVMSYPENYSTRGYAMEFSGPLSSEADGNQIRPSALQRWVGSWLRVYMARFAPAVKQPNSLAEVFDAAWVVVGRRRPLFEAADFVDALTPGSGN